ncbi:MAG: SRPBCC family protein [Actinomycetota bacterium]
MNQTEINETIQASIDQVWEVLFSQYGDIHIHNPLMTASNYMHGATEGGPDVVRHCEFGKKFYLDEKITDVDEQKGFRVEAGEHNFPFVTHMSATYELSSPDENTTEVHMVSFNSYAPGFMRHLLGRQTKKTLAKHLFGLRYYIETGNTLDPDNYDEIFAAHT